MTLKGREPFLFIAGQPPLLSMNHNISIFQRLPLGSVLKTIVMALVLCTLVIGPAIAEEEEKGLMDVQLSKNPDPLDASVETSIDHLFEVLADPAASFDAARVAPMLDFIVNGPEDPKDIQPARRFDGNGVCLKKPITSSLENILRYFYNKDIPNFLLCPAVLRMSGWHDDSEFLTAAPLWDSLPGLTEPVVVRGREYEVNTPDSFAEAYYRYDLNRLIILLPYQGKNVLISVSEQADKSDVGRKGAILDDQQWEYFYSGIEGLNKGMIGWMDTFMYKSASVLVFVENDAAAPQTTTFLFKWLDAGWAGMNVVKRSHIYDGSLRYARSLAKVLESPTLTPDQVMAGMAEVNDLSLVKKDFLIREYAKNFETRFADNPKLQKKEYAKVIKDGGYYEVLDNEARESVLALEKLKSLIGMEPLIAFPGSGVTESASAQ